METLTQSRAAEIEGGEKKAQEKVAHVLVLVHTQKPSFFSLMLLMHILRTLLPQNLSSLLPLQPFHLSGPLVNWAKAWEIWLSYKPPHLLHQIAQIELMRYELEVS